MATRKPPKEGAPSWTYVVGAIVALGGLAWTIASYFLPKEDKTPAAPVVQQSATAASGGIAVNADGGSVVSFGDSAPAASALPASALPARSASQTASAGDSGKAINASGGSKVIGIK